MPLSDMTDLPEFNQRVPPPSKPKRKSRAVHGSSRAVVQSRGRAAVLPSSRATSRGATATAVRPSSPHQVKAARAPVVDTWYDDEPDVEDNLPEQGSEGEIQQNDGSSRRCGWVKRHGYKVLIALAFFLLLVILLAVLVPRNTTSGDADPSLVGGGMSNGNPTTTTPSPVPAVQSKPPTPDAVVTEDENEDDDASNQDDPSAPSSALLSPAESPSIRPFTFPPVIVGSNESSSGVILNQFGEVFGYPPDGVAFCLSSAVSGDGTTVALMNRIVPDSSDLHVTVYQFDGVDWFKMGGDIVGEGDNAINGNGHALALSQRGTTLVIGFFTASCNLGENCGRAQVYSFENEKDTWEQLGSDVIGEEPNVFLGLAVAISRNGKTVAIGEPFNNGADGTIHRGKVRVLRFDGSVWTPIGTELVGDEMRDQLGSSVALSGDGTIVACGAPREGTGKLGFVKVAQYDESTDSFTELGSYITGEDWLQQFGAAIALSGDGKKIAISGFTTRGSGMVSVLMLEGVAWIKINGDIESPAGLDRFGSSVDMDDLGNRVVVGASETSSMAGAAYLYQLERKGWKQRGKKIESLYTEEALLGRSVSLSSSGLVVAAGGGYGVQIYFDSGIGGPDQKLKGFELVGDIIGRANGDEKCISSTISRDGSTAAVASRTKENKLIVRVYVFDPADGWIQIGDDIWGRGSIDAVGKSIALSETGTMLAIGLYNEPCELGENCGSVRVYSNQGNGWIQVGQDIMGNAVQAFFGWSVAIANDGLTVAAGAPISHGSNGTEHPGKVRIFVLDNDSKWAQVGPDLEGDADWDHLGSSLTMSGNGDYVATGAVQGQPGDNGYAKVYSYDPNTNSYAQVGDSIIGDNRTDMFGDSVALTEDGLTLVVGAATTGVNADMVGRSSSGQSFGLVSVFRNGNSTWTQAGPALESGRRGDLFGYSVAVDASGSTIVVGAPEDFSNSGSAYVFLYDGSEWAQHGDTVFHVEENGSEPSQLGRSVAVSKSGEFVSVGSNMGLSVYQLDFSSKPAGDASPSSPLAFSPFAFSPSSPFASPVGGIQSSPFAWSPAGMFTPSSPSAMFAAPASPASEPGSQQIGKQPAGGQEPGVMPFSPSGISSGMTPIAPNMPSSSFGTPSSPAFASPVSSMEGLPTSVSSPQEGDNLDEPTEVPGGLEPGTSPFSPSGVASDMTPVAPNMPSSFGAPSSPFASPMSSTEGSPTSVPIPQEGEPDPTESSTDAESNSKTKNESGAPFAPSSPFAAPLSPAQPATAPIAPFVPMSPFAPASSESSPSFQPNTADETSSPMIEADPTSAPVEEVNPTSAPTVKIDPTSAPMKQEEPTTAPAVEIDPTSAPTVKIDPSSAPVTEEEPTQGPVVQAADPTSVPTVAVDPTSSAPATEGEPTSGLVSQPVTTGEPGMPSSPTGFSPSSPAAYFVASPAAASPASAAYTPSSPFAPAAASPFGTPAVGGGV